MAWTSLTSSQPISFANNSHYRNSARENIYGTGDPGTPVYFTPNNATLNEYGYGGPRYKYGYTYDTCPTPESNYNGNCTWWCWGRLHQTMGTSLPNMGDAKNWYSNYSGEKDTDASNIQPGDIIVLTDDDAGHVMFVEKVDGDTITISQSAYSTRSIWDGMACLVTTYDRNDISAGEYLNMYKDLSPSGYSLEVVGVIHTGEEGPTPPGPGPGPDPGDTETPEISINPSSASVTMGDEEDYVDVTFNITITGIPSGESASGGNTYPGLSRVYNSGWSYTTYTVDGTVYRRANKIQTLRYYRENDSEYSITKYMYFNKTFSNGSIISATRISIHVLRKKGEGILFLEWDGATPFIL